MTKRRTFLRPSILALLFIAGCARVSGCTPALFSSGGWAIERIDERWNQPVAEEDLITFKNGKTWENLGMKAEKIAEITGPGDSRILAFKALSCVECEPDLLLTIRSSAGGAVVSESFPGSLTSIAMETGVSAPKSFGFVRAFYGKCLDGMPTEVFVVESTLSEEGKVVRKLITPTPNGLETTDLEKLPNAARGGSLPGGCREIAGVDRNVDE